MPLHLTSVDPEAGYAQLHTGERIPITHMYTEDGKEIWDPALCRRGVAGPDSEGMWHGFSCSGEEDGEPTEATAPHRSLT